MGNSAFKKEQAKRHNEIRAAEKKRLDELTQDKIDNPEKYKRVRSVRKSREAQALIATAIGFGIYPLPAPASPTTINNKD